MNYEFKGTVTEVLDTITVGSNGFQKREFRVREDKGNENQYPNIVPFILKKDKVSLADSLREGAKVNVHWSPNGRIWDKGDGTPTRCYCDNECWKIDILSAPEPAQETPQEELSVEDYANIPF